MKLADPLNKKWGGLNKTKLNLKKCTDQLHFDRRTTIHKKWIRVVLNSVESPYDFEDKFMEFRDSPKIPEPLK